jgi:hypothetical protein
VLPLEHEERADPLDFDDDNEFIAKTRLDMQTLPLYLYRKVYRVLRKYKTSDVFKKGEVYMQVYNMLHSSEKPCDLRKVNIPFQNSFELQRIDKELNFQLGQRKQQVKDKSSQQIVQENLKSYYKNSSMFGHLFEGRNFSVKYF